ncbi:hypothetical protein L1887_25643 [Cichorium endivia]|nr:hypothetical protein L1887_25643 [Cichorium endivia]
MPAAFNRRWQQISTGDGSSRDRSVWQLQLSRMAASTEKTEKEASIFTLADGEYARLETEEMPAVFIDQGCIERNMQLTICLTKGMYN